MAKIVVVVLNLVICFWGCFFALSLLPLLHHRLCLHPHFGGPRIRPNLDITAGLPIGLGREGCRIRPLRFMGRCLTLVGLAEYLNSYPHSDTHPFILGIESATAGIEPTTFG